MISQNIMLQAYRNSRPNHAPSLLKYIVRPVKLMPPLHRVKRMSTLFTQATRVVLMEEPRLIEFI